MTATVLISPAGTVASPPSSTTMTSSSVSVGVGQQRAAGDERGRDGQDEGEHNPGAAKISKVHGRFLRWNS